MLKDCKYFEGVGNFCSRVTAMRCDEFPECEFKYIAELKAENAKLYEEKDCLHKIIDRLLENAGYSKDIASAEDFEDVYENMQYKNNKLEEYKQTLQEIKEIAEANQFYFEPGTIVSCETIKQIATNFDKILDLITKAESEG